MERTILENNELFRISNGIEQHYFTSLHRAAEYLGSQRAQVLYAYIRDLKYNKEWLIEIVDGSEIKYKDINCDGKKEI